jgi:hypothetical protein
MGKNVNSFQERRIMLRSGPMTKNVSLSVMWGEKPCYLSLRTQRQSLVFGLPIFVLELFRNFSFWRTKGSTTTVEKRQKTRILSKNHGFLRDLKPTFGWQRTNRVLEQVHYAGPHTPAHHTR